MSTALSSITLWDSFLSQLLCRPLSWKKDATGSSCTNTTRLKQTSLKKSVYRLRWRLSVVTVWPDVRSSADHWYWNTLYSCVLKWSQRVCDVRFPFYCLFIFWNVQKPWGEVRKFSFFLWSKEKQLTLQLSSEETKWRRFHVRKKKSQDFFFFSFCVDSDISSLGFTDVKTSSVFPSLWNNETNVSLFSFLDV